MGLLAGYLDMFCLMTLTIDKKICWTHIGIYRSPKFFAASVLELFCTSCCVCLTVSTIFSSQGHNVIGFPHQTKSQSSAEFNACGKWKTWQKVALFFCNSQISPFPWDLYGISTFSWLWDIDKFTIHYIRCYRAWLCCEKHPHHIGPLPLINGVITTVNGLTNR